MTCLQRSNQSKRQAKRDSYVKALHLLGYSLKEIEHDSQMNVNFKAL